MASNQGASSSGRSGQPHQRTSSYPYPQRESSLQNDLLSASKRPQLYPRNAAAAQSTTSIVSSSRSPSRQAQEAAARSHTPNTAPLHASRENPRHHQQGFFEPSLPTAANSSFSHAPGTSTLSQSQIAALAAMHVTPQNERRTSQPKFEHQTSAGAPSTTSRKPSHPPPIQTTQLSSSRAPSAQSIRPDSRSTAASAASAAFPQSPLDSPADYTRDDYFVNSPGSEREQKAGKEKTRRKLFSKPKNIHISKDKDVKGYPPVPKTAGIYGASGMVQQSQSTISLVDSLYSNPNASTSTLVPSDRIGTGDKDRDKGRHNFLSRQKNKLKDDHHVALSSASSNSRPLDPVQPNYLYNFAPSSPGLGGKSFSGFDLRHAGRALREKKKEEKAPATLPPLPGSGTTTEQNAITTADWPIPSGYQNNAIGFATQSPYHASVESPYSTTNVSGTSDDPWTSLRKLLLQIFHRDAEELRVHIEDLNRLVLLHIQRCIGLRAPQVMLEDLNDLLRTGFHGVDVSLRTIQDERLLVPHLVEIWSFVFSSVLPFLQAVFLPLDLELKGRGPLLSHKEAADFWAGLPPHLRPSPDSTPNPPNLNQSANTTRPSFSPNAPPTTDTRTLVLLHFRDSVILPRHDTLLNIFSRLSLDSLIHSSPLTSLLTSLSDMPPPPIPPGMQQQRPGTAGSSSGTNLDPSSFNSQSSTLLDSTGGSSSLGARSRATSNTSAGSFASAGSSSANAPGRFAPTITSSSSGAGASIGGIRAVGTASAAAPLDSAKITQTAARMLQCLSILASLRGLGSSFSTTPAAPTSGGGRSTPQQQISTPPARDATNPLSSPPSQPGIASPERPLAARNRSGTNSGISVSFGEEDREAQAQRKMKQLAKELKLNWMGRGRTGRNRKGMVPGKVRTPGAGGVAVGA